VQEVEFLATTSGAFFYWASMGDSQMAERSAVDSQLSGAFIVDPPGGQTQPDRIFVLGHWDEPADPKATPPKPEREAWTINGKSWPDTERVTYRSGEHVRWFCLNPTDERHPLHMHGQYFQVEATGDEQHWMPIAAASRRLVATETVPVGGALALAWIPKRPGNWLFHCHILFHVAPELRLTQDAHSAGHAEHGLNHIAGLVLGITVTGVIAATTAVPGVRRLELAVGPRKGIDLHADPGVGNRLDEAGQNRTNPDGSFISPGPPIVLTRGQAVEIAVTNWLRESTTVHWHGIELESYYDGVAGWGGDGHRITPPIRPGETFVARFTPPRAGTFIYHTHLNDYVELSTGLYGPLIVTEQGQRFDPDLDKILVLSRGGTDNDKDPFLINGSATPGSIDLVAGKQYRFRIIGITPNPVLDVQLEQNGEPVKWRPAAKDGVDLPPGLALPGPARLIVNPGETFDFNFQTSSAGSLRFTATNERTHLQTVLPIQVRAR
jgi:FtsP/CotA-like multicopper oxidase with cupredoxin domain